MNLDAMVDDNITDGAHNANKIATHFENRPLSIENAVSNRQTVSIFNKILIFVKYFFY